ncbi:dihydrolipoyl dehydrogenase [Pontiella sulfatireligans]|uniref:Dihydrolipoyl dehydrogenase n=1 Tax=Pontiella sulfatireligans TaxID=2750658 RepID=A0A6C2UI09_9BACT|nr:dihydrolipoyl dehydrogenase [Pontiella sulfatireligans]VGO19835.1 Dihydrolipoyl dehydrogenase [Pontiella sulfatireligans]
MDFDVIVIGAGPGGYPAAIKAAQLGGKTAIIEREWLGGTCLNCGCIPTKTLIAGAEVYQKILHADTFGINVGTPEIDYPAMKTRKDGVVDTLKSGIGSLLKAHGVTVFEGEGSFRDANTIAVKASDGATQEITGKNIIIATGSTSTVPGFIPKHERIVESRAFLDLEKLPESLLVLGGGYIGCELACMAAGLGVKVTVVELLADVLMLLDKDVRQVVKKNMKDALGMTLMTGDAMENIAATDTGVTATAGGKTIEADMLLVAIGRSPVTDGLNIEAAGVAVNERGYVEVDELNRTNVSGIYCIGDVSGRLQLAHAATSQAMYAVEHALKGEEKIEEVVIPGVIFTSPEVALVGITETDAKTQSLEISTGKFYFRGLGKALASNETEGFVKIIADKNTDRILGAQCAGPHATDLISEMVVAVREELTVEELGNTVHAHPTFAEVWMEAAHALHKACIHAPPAR